ncbi:MAG: hypothetical protein KC635_14480, partial [Myxococcales bacterium]|nr:hypothetical protein [Myxococcales bacterium]
DAAEAPAPLGDGERAAAITAALDALLELDPDVIATLNGVVFPPPVPGTGNQLGCPVLLTYDYGTAGSYYWQGECTAEDGTSYSGYGAVARYVDYPADGNSLVTGYQLTLAGRITAPDGTWLEGTGTATAYTARSTGVVGFARQIDGTFTAGGPRAPASPWLDGSRRPSATVSGWVYEPTGGNNLTFDGGIAGLTGFPADITAVAFDGLTFRAKAAGASCADEPGGAVSVRGPDGSWYDVLFDGPTDDAPETDAATCDGCGETWFRGDAIGGTCVDAADYLGWEGTPW